MLGLHYKMHWPGHQPVTSRGVRKSALHDRWARLGASFGEGMGGGRPMWFAGEGENTDNGKCLPHGSNAPTRIFPASSFK
ncbi:hypothetical protein [Mesorhizobium sp. WSM3882]|uniref:hypothetical protein n=1 Tax=Mesorhizobium sp. WSM3882 TaxID=2029407 RepID=UPI001FD9AF76|nr:hypothetical protein [Mesorhizobium sp. WSM3882]